MTELAHRNDVLQQVYSTGRVALSSGGFRDASQNGMPRAEGEQLYEIVRREKPKQTLEVGMAFGLSTLFITQALSDNGGGRHIAIDPNQATDYDNVGLRHLQQAGLRELVDFHQESSHRALPRLESVGTMLDFAFIDGVHLFDYTLIEFFYIDRMLRTGGVIVFDDLHLPAVRKAVRYAVQNRGYQDESTAPDTGVVRRAGRRVKRLLGGIATLPNALHFAVANERHESIAIDLGWPRTNGLAILRKTRDDDRVWTHYVDF